MGRMRKAIYYLILTEIGFNSLPNIILAFYCQNRVEGKKILRVQKKNLLKDVLLDVFSLPPFDFAKDKKIVVV